MPQAKTEGTRRKNVFRTKHTKTGKVTHVLLPVEKHTYFHGTAKQYVTMEQ
jgi:hypothetical protein